MSSGLARRLLVVAPLALGCGLPRDDGARVAPQRPPPVTTTARTTPSPPPRTSPTTRIAGPADDGPATDADAHLTFRLDAPRQTLDAPWEVKIQAGYLPLDPRDYERFHHRYKDRLIELVVDDLGFNRGQMAVRAGAEHPRDAFGEWWVDRSTGRGSWVSVWYDSVNDNDDPFRLDPVDPDDELPHDFVGFHFTELDLHVEDLILDMVRHADERGVDFYLYLTVVDFASSSFELRDDPEEYAEFVLATFLHLDRKYGLVPDGLEIQLEPDMSDKWTPTQLGRALVAAHRRLARHGYEPDIIGPSCTSVKSALFYFDRMIEVPGVLDALDELSYHTYGGRNRADLAGVRRRAERHGLRTSMLEWWTPDNDCRAMLEDLTVGGVSALQRGVMGLTGRPNNKPGLYVIDVSDPERPVPRPNRRTPYVRMVTRHVRPGAVVHDVASDHPAFAPVGFVNADGGAVVVVVAEGAGTISIDGLPAGDYFVSHVTPRGTEDEPSRSHAEGRPLVVEMPGEGVLAVHADLAGRRRR